MANTLRVMTRTFGSTIPGMVCCTISTTSEPSFLMLILSLYPSILIGTARAFFLLLRRLSGAS
ncbi:hypothetical protein JG688_00012326 [Phytophthora aleatoria]|uniref:Uncharacterized protein n=1 Tax=Phytophthora aleatoria TaxID=2496075 RepID=A0A8J5IB27_9STRA|nr:hypothetical protein JG688_00012326 [Phytophthora aleatoria]